MPDYSKYEYYDETGKECSCGLGNVEIYKVDDELIYLCNSCGWEYKRVKIIN